MSESQLRFAEGRAAAHAAELMAEVGKLSRTGSVRDRIGLAIQLLVRDARQRGADPADAVDGVAKGLGSVLAFAGAGGDLGPVLEQFDKAVRDYHARTVDRLAHTHARGGHG